MRLRLVLQLMTLTLLLMPVPSNAQNNETWFYAWDYDAGDLFAYTPAGDVRLLIDAADFVDNSEVNDWIGNPFTLQSGALVVPISVGGEIGFYLLRDGVAQRFENQFDIDLIPFYDLEDSPRDSVVEGPRAMVIPLLSWDYHGGAEVTVDLEDDQVRTFGELYPTALLVDFEALTISLIDNIYWYINPPIREGSLAGDNCCRFSEDGELLRYFIFDSSSLLLKERALATGEERTIHVISVFDIEAGRENFAIEVDRHGERWLVHDRHTNIMTIIHSNGNVETLLPEVSPYRGVARQFLGDDLVTFDCQSKCFLHLYAPDSFIPTTFELPASEYQEPLLRIGEERLLVFGSAEYGMEYSILRTNGAPSVVGHDPCHHYYQVFAPCSMNPLSPDGRLLLYTAEREGDAPHYVLWDLLNEVALIDEPCCTVEEGYRTGFAGFDDEGFQFSADSPTRKWVYFYNDGDLAELPAPEERSYFELLADGTLLYGNDRDLLYGTPDIYHYEPYTRTSTLLLEDSRPLLSYNFHRGG